MKMRKHKITALILTLALIFSCMPVFAIDEADENTSSDLNLVDELTLEEDDAEAAAENNVLAQELTDERADPFAAGASFPTATQIALNKPVSDYLSKSGENDYFKFTLAQEGLVQIAFARPMQAKSSAYWRVSVYDSKQERLVYTQMTGNYTESQVPDMGLPAGTYYIKVETASYHSSDTYTITVKYTVSDQWEKEYNDAAPNASFMSVNKQYYGSLGTLPDKDYYMFTTSGTGVVKITFTSKMQEKTSNYWRLSLYDKNIKEITHLNIGGGYEKTSFPQIGLPAGTYYIEVEEASYYSDDTYGLRVDYAASNLWEKEINDSAAKASPMNAGTAIHGSLCDISDKDYYVINISRAGKYKVALRTPMVSKSGSYWQVYIYDTNVNSLDNYNVKGTSGGGSKDIYLAAGRYYIKVVSGSYYSGATYDLSISLKPDVIQDLAAVKISKPKAGKGSMTVKWKKVSKKNRKKIQGIEIQVSTDSTFSNIVKSTTAGKKKTSKKIKGLSKKTKYWVRIRAYRNDTNGKHVSAWKYKSIKVK